MAGSSSNSLLSFLRNCHTSFHSDCIFYIPTSNTQEFQFFHILTNTLCFLKAGLRAVQLGDIGWI